MALSRVIYRSHSRLLETTFEEEVGQIVRTSISNNRLANITGMLLTHRGSFLQVLEGPSAAIDATVERIRKDTRHEGVVTLSNKPAPQRRFGDWDMCARTLSAADDEIVQVMEGRGDVAISDLSADAALRLLTVVASIRRDANLRHVG